MSVAELQAGVTMIDNGFMTERFLSTTEIGLLWGVSRPAAAKAFEGIEPDAVIGEIKGWKHETVDRVRAARPGRGNWGPRASDGEQEK